MSRHPLALYPFAQYPLARHLHKRRRADARDPPRRRQARSEKPRRHQQQRRGAQRRMGLAALASVAVPLALLWAGLALWLGRTQQRMATATASARAAQDVRRHDVRGQVR